MSKVIVLVLPDDAEFGTTLRAVEDAMPEGTRILGGLEDVAERVLEQFTEGSTA